MIAFVKMAFSIKKIAISRKNTQEIINEVTQNSFLKK